MWINKNSAARDLDPFRSVNELVFRFREVGQSVLDPKDSAFLLENAPAHAIASYCIRQQQLTRLSLRLASETVFRSVAAGSAVESTVSISHVADSPTPKVRALFLLLICLVGRMGLCIFQCLSSGIPQRIQFWLPARVLCAIGASVSYTLQDLPQDNVGPGRVSRMHDEDSLPDGTTSEASIPDEVRRALATALPNDISRMIYIATLRDNDTGGYYHPSLARRFTLKDADRAMLTCHLEIYERLVSLELEDLTDQLDVYFAGIRAPKERSIENWRKLRAYRATIPIRADPISAEILFMKIDVALAILKARLPGETH